MDDATARILEDLSRGILASEDWAPGYRNAPKQHAAMIKQGAHLHRLLIEHFKQVAKDIPSGIDWYNYQRAVIEQQRAMQADANIQAYDVNVIINKDQVNAHDQQFIKVVFDTVASVIELGAESGLEEYGFALPVGLTSTSAIVQELTTEQLAHLVGMRIDKQTGLITPNPNPRYSIDETTRSRIVNSIKTSIRLGENQKQAAARLFDVVADSARADMIAHTETVRAYAEGRHAYGEQSGAKGKAWNDANATDICADNTMQGIIPIDANFVSGDPYEPAHPHCKCLTVLIYGDDIKYDDLG
jgi:hypothetical protein